ncbi:MAG: hypothetical protein AABX50_00430 [Nanoarchaeota archaeon]
MVKSKNTIEKEIEYWTAHQDLDKFNYGAVSSSILALIAIFISILGVVSDLQTTGWVSWLKVIVLIFILVSVFIFLRLLKKEPQRHDIAFTAREEMIKYRYGKIGVAKDELNEEFEDIKKILLETRRDPECRRARIEKYYSDKEKESKNGKGNKKKNKEDRG